MSEVREKRCPVCNWSPAELWMVETLTAGVACEICGEYAITAGAQQLLKHPDNDGLRPALGIHLRQAADAGSSVVLTSENLHEIADSMRSRPSVTKVRRLLELAAADSRLGRMARLPNEHGTALYVAAPGRS